MKWVALLAGLFSGIAGAMGLGGGAVLIIYLSLFHSMPQMEAQGINLMFFIPTALAAVIVYGIKKQIKWRLVLKTAAFGMIGSGVGVLLSDYLGGTLTSKIFGGLLVVMGIIEIFGRKKNTQK